MVFSVSVYLMFFQELNIEVNFQIILYGNEILNLQQNEQLVLAVHALIKDSKRFTYTLCQSLLERVKRL